MAVYRTDEDWKGLGSSGGFVLLSSQKRRAGTISIHIEGFSIELGLGWERDELLEVLRAVREACGACLP